MRKIFLLLTVLAGFSMWCVAQNAPAAAAGQSAPQKVQIINGPVIEHVDNNSAQIAWSTNVSASTQLKYGTDPNNLDKIEQVPWGGMTHRITLSNLQPNTTYYFKVESAEAQGTGTSAISSMKQFQTIAGEAPAANAGPVIAQNATPAQATASADDIILVAGPVIQTPTDTQVTLWWTTNKDAETKVMFGATPQQMTSVAEKPYGGTVHKLEITGLQSDTVYYYSIQSATGYHRADGRFKTEPANFAQGSSVRIIDGPVIEYQDTNSATIAWSTNARSSSIVHYGVTPDSMNQTAEATWGPRVHRVTINNLQPGSVYYFQVESSQAKGTGTSAKSSAGVLRTVPQGQQAFRNPGPR